MTFQIRRLTNDARQGGVLATLEDARECLDAMDQVMPLTYYAIDIDSGQRFLSAAARAALRRSGGCEHSYFSRLDDERKQHWRLSPTQASAVLTFKRVAGRAWREQLMRCWERGRYLSLGEIESTALDQLRRQLGRRGPEWLVNVQTDDLAQALDTSCSTV